MLSNRLFRRLFVSAPPSVAVSISGSAVAAVQMDWKKGGPKFRGYGHARLEEGAVTPMANGANVVDVGSLNETIREVIGQLKIAPSRIALILPDIVGKVSIVRLVSVPSRKTDLDEVLRWKIAESVPYPVEDAQIAYSSGIVGADGTREFVVSAVKREVVEEYESACLGAGLNPGYVDLETFNVINAVTAASLLNVKHGKRSVFDADWMLVNNAADNASVAIVRKDRLLSFRSLRVSNGTRLSDVMHQACMYYNDRLSGDSLERAYLINYAGEVVPTEIIDYCREPKDDYRTESGAKSFVVDGELVAGGDELVGLESASVRVELLAARLRMFFCGRIDITTGLFDQLLAPLGVLCLGASPQRPVVH